MQSDTLTFLIQSSYQKFSSQNAIQFYCHGELETTLTYKQLDQDTNQMVHYFVNKRVKKGDRVILLMEKSVIFIHRLFDSVNS